MSDLKNCYDEAPGICLRNKCEKAEIFKDKLYCLNSKDIYDITPVDRNFTAKHDEGKLQIHLVPTQIIRDIAEVRMYGNAKYGDPDNWKTVEKWRYVDALFRHLLLYLDDPDGVDDESGIKHYKHAACNMAFICAMEDGEEKPADDAVKWIPVTERLPEQEQDVLAWVETEQRTACCHYANDKWFDAILDKTVKPLAWMPLPKPYTADRKTEPQTERDCETCDHQYSGNGCWNCLSNAENNYKPQTERSEQ